MKDKNGKHFLVGAVLHSADGEWLKVKCVEIKDNMAVMEHLTMPNPRQRQFKIDQDMLYSSKWEL